MDEFSAQIDALKREPVARLREPEQLEWLLHALGRANEGRQLDDVRHLIEEALDGRDGLPVLRSELATRFFALGLSSAHAPARRLACEQLARLATPDDVRTLVESGALALLGALVADPELAVAHAARACLVAAARSCASSELEQDLVLTPQLLAELSGFASRPGPKNAPVRMRALEVSAQCASLSPRAFAACQRAGLLQMVRAARAARRRARLGVARRARLCPALGLCARPSGACAPTSRARRPRARAPRRSSSAAG